MKGLDNLREYVTKQAHINEVVKSCVVAYIDGIEREVKELTDERDLLKTQWEAGVDFDQRLESCASERRDDVTLWGVDYTPLPLDADGVPIHVGDVMEWDNGTFTVHELKVTEDGWTTWDEQHGYTVHTDETHHHAPTVEDVLTEMFAKAIERSELTNGAAQTIAEYAAKLRLAGEDA